jgi:putative colanic acid biosysnthesis UDP-glucose lipid carrier transferase
VPDVFGISIIQGRLQDMNGVPVVGLCETPFTGTNRLVKRVSDVVLASLILLLVSPLMLAIAIGVKLSSPGPVIFRQRRNGLDGEEIIVWKFRTMTLAGRRRRRAAGDPRRPAHHALRRLPAPHSLDELPQFFNVLQGHMSIVGPRPHAVAHNEQYRR